jgi:hypothetical protein
MKDLILKNEQIYKLHEKFGGTERTGLTFERHQNPCNRCGGEGGGPQWVRTGYVCYKCGGHGKGSGSFYTYVGTPTPDFLSIIEEKNHKLIERRQRLQQKKLDKANQIKALKLQAFQSMLNADPEMKTVFELRNSLSEFAQNVCISIDKLGYWTDKQRQVLVTEYQKMVERMKQPASEFVGTVGEKIQLQVKIRNILTFSSNYGNGISYLILMKDDKGNDLKWSTSNGKQFQIDQELELSGIVKEHTTYKDRKQTILTRCKVV